MPDAREDHLGSWFSGIENYPEGGVVRTFSRKKLERIFDACGVGERSFIIRILIINL